MPLIEDEDELEDPDDKSLCRCGHEKGDHTDSFNCTLCECKDFQYKE